MKIFTTALLLVAIGILVHSVFTFLSLRKHLRGALYCSKFEVRSISTVYLILILLFVVAYVLFLLFWIQLPAYDALLYMIMALLFFGSVFVGVSMLFLDKFVESTLGLKRNQTDTMTGLLTKNGIELAARNLLEEGTGKDCMVVLDLDNFKRVNDELGHDKGDEVIRMVAQTIKDTVRSEDLIGRFGGDEYVVILKNADEVSARTILTRIQYSVEQKLAKDGFTMCGGISYGLSTLIGGSHESYESVFKRADQHLYRMKEERKNSD